MALADDVITEARGYLQDTVVGAYRYSDSDLYTYLNDAVKFMATNRSDLFVENVSFTCAAGTEQKYPSTSSLGVTDIIANQSGEALREMSIEVLDNFRPGWANDTPGIPKNWARQKNSKFIFYLYPGIANGVAIELQHINLPTYAVGNTIDGRLLPYTSAIAEYIVGAALMRDQEGASDADSMAYKNSFAKKIGAK